MSLSTRVGLQEGVTAPRNVRLGLCLLHQKGSKSPGLQMRGLWGLNHSSHKNQRRRGPGYLRVGDIPVPPPLSGSVTSASSESPSRAEPHQQ